MSTNTTNYNIVKPDLNETADIGVINSNMDIIDSALTPTADPAQVPTGLSGKLSQWVSWIANRIKAITGKTNWYDAPSKTLEDLNTHLSDNTHHVPYAVATGAANTYVVTLNPTSITYVDGMAICVKINVASTGASTLNVNGLGAKAIKDSLGNAITSGGLKANTPYTMRYEATSGNFILQGKGGGGNATADKLLSPYTATVDTGQITGTMVDQGSKTFTPSGSQQTAAVGYYSSITVNSIPLTAGDILLASSDAKHTCSTVTFTQAKKFTIHGNGTIRFKVNGYNSYNSGYLKVLKNGVLYDTAKSVGTTVTTFTFDIPVNDGDTIEVYGETDNAIYATEITNARVYVGLPPYTAPTIDVN